MSDVTPEEDRVMANPNRWSHREEYARRYALDMTVKLRSCGQVLGSDMMDTAREFYDFLMGDVETEPDDN